MFNIFKRNKPVIESRQIQAGSISVVDFVSGNGSNVMNIPVFYSCTKAISTGLASVPLKIQKLVKGNWVDDTTHYLNTILTTPNQLYNKNVFIEAIVKDALLKKSGYAIIEKNRQRKVTGLYRVPPNQIDIQPDNMFFPRFITYSISSLDNVQYDSSEIIVLTNNIADDNYTGVGLQQFTKDTTALNDVLVKSAVTGFTTERAQRIVAIKGRSNGMKMDDVLKSLERTKNGGLAVVEADSVSITEPNKNNKEAMLIEARQFSAKEICVFFNIHPSFIGLNDTNAISSDALEAIQRQFVSVTLEPWFDKLELEYKKLLTTGEQANYRIVFDRAANLKTSTKNQAEIYKTLVLSGIITPNEAAKRMGLPVSDNGDDLLVVGGVTKLKDLDLITAKNTDNKVLGAINTNTDGKGEKTEKSDNSEN